MSVVTRSQTSHHTTSRTGLADWIAGQAASALALSWRGKLCCAGGLAAVVLVVVMATSNIAGGWLPRLWGGARLPASASERAPMFVEAWIQGDQAAMKRFVRLGDEGKLAAWTAATPVPPGVTAIPASERTIKTVSVQRDDADGAVVEIRIASRADAPAGAKSPGGIVLDQTWSYSGGNWLFSPGVAPAPPPAPRHIERPPAAVSQQVAVPRLAPRQPRPASDDLDCH